MPRETFKHLYQIGNAIKRSIQYCEQEEIRKACFIALDKLQNVLIQELQNLPAITYVIKAEVYDDPARQLREIKEIQAKHPYEKIEFKRDDYYPEWTCSNCAVKAGCRVAGVHTLSWHNGKCCVCCEEIAVTHPRNYCYPQFVKGQFK